MGLTISHEKATPLVDGQLYALGCTVPHGGQIHWVADGSKGEAALNAYLLLEGDKAVILDTSYPIAESVILDQLKPFALNEVKLLLTRAVEFDSVGNADLIVENYNVTEAWAGYYTFEWVYHRSMDGIPATIPFKSFTIPHDETVEFFPGRKLDLINSRLKLLTATWVYDAKTKTLFTSDAFNHVSSPAPGVRVVTAATDTTTLETVVAWFRTKFSWMEGADTEPLRASVKGIFERYDIDRIAPTNGCIIEGKALAKKHYALTIEALELIHGGK